MPKVIDTRTDIVSAVRESADFLSRGDLFIYPTDTIYGIGSDIYDETALKRIADIKGREKLQPYIILISSFDMLSEFANLSDDEKRLLEKYWPGPLTVILNSKIKLSPYIDNKIGKIAVRMPDNEYCLKLISEYGKPITSTSANLHGKEQGSFDEILQNFNSYVDLFIYSGEVNSFKPSTIIDLTSTHIKLLRKGAIEDFG